MVQYNNRLLIRTVEKPVPYNVAYTKADVSRPTKIISGPAVSSSKGFVYSTQGWNYDEVFVQPVLTSNGEYPYSEFCTFASSYFAEDTQPYYATQPNNERWQSDNSISLPQYIGYFSNRPIKVESITMNNNSSPDANFVYNPYNFKLQGSNDGTTWVDLLSVTSNPNYNNNDEDGYTLDVNSSEGYYFHRLYVESVRGGRPVMVSYLRLNGKVGNK